jgi:hypothetical protein
MLSFQATVNIFIGTQTVYVFLVVTFVYVTSSLKQTTLVLSQFFCVA